jgi:catechol 2,3-dioxygenase-like lactoylglutathione lyase family enzyme
VEQRVSLITLGVADLERARRFYEALGWRSPSSARSDVVFFQSGGMVVALWGRAELAADCGLPAEGVTGAVALAHNVRSPAEVDAILEQARTAGATISREAGRREWGGYTGVFLDPDGHPWEVAHNPHWPLAPDGSVSLAAPPG